MLYAKVERTVDRALALARERRHGQATLVHLLLALTENVAAQAVLEACRLDAEQLRGELGDYLETELAHLVTGGTVMVSANTSPGARALKLGGNSWRRARVSSSR